MKRTNRKMNCYLGIDTSNYTTSMALVNNEGQVLADERILLKVKKGMRGLRQSEALFQHIRNLPALSEKIMRAKENYGDFNIRAIGASSKPRPVEDSYMPVFLAGTNFGKTLSRIIGIPYFEFSHQEGHIEAIRHFNCPESEKFLTIHMSGGTTEIIEVDYNINYDNLYKVRKIGGSADISIGQLLDRVGVSLGCDFPAGAQLDRWADDFQKKGYDTSDKFKISPIKIKDFYFNLSGIESQAQRAVKECIKSDSLSDKKYMAYKIFSEIAECLLRLFRSLYEKNYHMIILAGGVSQSEFLRKKLLKNRKETLIRPVFGSYGGDNGVGISLLTMKKEIKTV